MQKDDLPCTFARLISELRFLPAHFSVHVGDMPDLKVHPIYGLLYVGMYVCSFLFFPFPFLFSGRLGALRSEISWTFNAFSYFAGSVNLRPYLLLLHPYIAIIAVNPRYVLIYCLQRKLTCHLSIYKAKPLYH